MGYSVYWANGRWQGYGVPAPCDFIGCKVEIDRGMGWQHPQDDEQGSGVPSIFSCSNHSQEPLEKFEIDLQKESKEWINHILTDDSWADWRKENPEVVEWARNLFADSSP